MSTNNFAFENRCIVVEDDDFTFENVPKHLEYVQGSNRNYPSYYLDEYRNQFYTLDIVITTAYYSGEEFYTTEFPIRTILDYYQESIQIIQLY